MKKNRISEPNVLNRVDDKLQKNTTEYIPVFLILALCLLAFNIFHNRSDLSQKNILSTSTDATEKYVWITGSPKVDEGLYLLTPKQLEKTFPELQPLITRTTDSPEFDSRVSAIQYESGLPKSINLPPVVANIFFKPIPINRAEKEILSTLPGIGPVLAERIIQRREDRGPYRSKDELLNISGIGPKKLAQLVDNIVLD
jgi:competence ComEA-like helix-hairpin-helix protein